MLIVCVLFQLISFVVPRECAAETIPIVVPDSYSGYQPVGLIAGQDGLIIAGNAIKDNVSWDISLLWISPNNSVFKHIELSGNKTDLIKKIVEMEDGFLALANSSSDSGALTRKSGILDIHLLSFSDSGENNWSTSLGGDGINYAQDVSVNTEWDSISVMGWFDTPGGLITNQYGGWDILVANYSLAGELLWAVTLGSVEDEVSGSLLQQNDRIYVLFNSWVKGRRWDVKLVVLDTQGTIVNEKSYGGTGSDIVNKVIETGDGNLMVLGTTDSIDQAIPQTRGKTDVWIMYIDPDGEILWQTRYGGSEQDLSHDIIRGSDGSFWLLATSESSDGDIDRHIGTWDLWVCEIDDEGKLLGTQTYGTLNQEHAVQILAGMEHIYFLGATVLSQTFSAPFVIKETY